MQTIKSKDFLAELRKYIGITRYGKGMQCCALTKSVIADKAAQSRLKAWYSQTASNNPNKRASETNKQYLDRCAGAGKYGADCCGLVKGIGYGNRVGGPTTRYISKEDITIEAMAAECKNKQKDVTKCKPGSFIWTSNYGHCAIVSEKGLKDIESAITTDGVKEVALTYQGGGKIIWAGGGELPWVDYSDQQDGQQNSGGNTPQPQKSVEDVAKEVIAGKWGVMPYRKERLELAGYNYREVQDVVNAMCAGTYNKPWQAGDICMLSATPIYASSDTAKVAAKRTGTHYVWSADVVRGRIRITNTAANVGRSGQVIGWANVSDIKRP